MTAVIKKKKFFVEISHSSHKGNQLKLTSSLRSKGRNFLFTNTA